MGQTFKVYEAALRFASAFHRDQKDKQGEPYIQHVIRVSTAVDGALLKTVALLHDTIEDGVSEQYLLTMFSEEIVGLVKTLSRKPDESYNKYIDRVRENPRATAIKIADLKDNTDPARMPNPTDMDIARTRKYLKALKRIQKEKT